MRESPGGVVSHCLDHGLPASKQGASCSAVNQPDGYPGTKSRALPEAGLTGIRFRGVLALPQEELGRTQVGGKNNPMGCGMRRNMRSEDEETVVTIDTFNPRRAVKTTMFRTFFFEPSVVSPDEMSKLQEIFDHYARDICSKMEHRRFTVIDGMAIALNGRPEDGAK